MTTTQHTQGPWEAEEYGVIRGRNGMIRPFICQVQDDHNDEETQANANLIASAPDLLAALREAVECLSFHGNPGIQLSREAVQGFIQSARAAIAKATGGEE